MHWDAYGWCKIKGKRNRWIPKDLTIGKNLLTGPTLLCFLRSSVVSSLIQLRYQLNQNFGPVKAVAKFYLHMRKVDVRKKKNFPISSEALLNAKRCSIISYKDSRHKSSRTLYFQTNVIYKDSVTLYR